jgi:hypothetical protein
LIAANACRRTGNRLERIGPRRLESGFFCGVASCPGIAVLPSL